MCQFINVLKMKCPKIFYLLSIDFKIKIQRIKWNGICIFFVTIIIIIIKKMVNISFQLNLMTTTVTLTQKTKGKIKTNYTLAAFEHHQPVWLKKKKILLVCHLMIIIEFYYSCTSYAYTQLNEVSSITIMGLSF